MHWRSFQELQKVIEVGDRFISYVDAGKGPPIVLLHGIPTWGYLWHKLTPSLERSHRVLIPDLPGYGYSDRSDRFDRGVARQAERLDAWMQALGLARAAFVGHDVGAAVALRLAAFHPERVEKLCLIDALAYDSRPLGALVSLAHPPEGRRLSPASVAKLLRAALKAGFSEPEEDLIDGLLSPYSTEEGRLSLLRDASALDASHLMEVAPLLPEIRKATLVLWGERDTVQPLAYGRRLAWDLPLARLSVVGESGHFPMVEKPGEVAAQLRNFLALG
jgi:pimeloyl-ACP methyl ester carboxylesterase